MTILRLTRREFGAALGSAAAWTVLARAQEMPVIAALITRSGRRGHRMMRRGFSGVTVLFATLLVVFACVFAAVSTAPCAEVIDATTPCPVAIQAFGSEKRAGQVLAGAPSPQVLEVGNYIMSVIEQLDSQYMKDGKSGIWADFSDQGKRAVAASAVANCRLHPERTIHDAAQAVYRSIREVHLQLGIVK